MLRTRYLIIVGTLVVVGCVRRPGRHSDGSEPAGAGCLAEIKPAIVVEIRDARTGAAVAQLARGVVQDGAYSDSLIAAAWESPDPTTMFARRAANERLGLYDVRVERAGYRSWRAQDIRVGADHCGVRTVRLQARLEPL